MKLVVKLTRDIKQSIGQFIAFVLIIAVGAFFYSGLVTYSQNLSAYTKDYFKEHRLSDLNVYYDRISSDDVAKLSEIEGVAKLEGRYTANAEQTFEDYKASIEIHSIPAGNEINTPTVTEGRLPSQKDEILLDSHYASEHQDRVGDRIRLSVGGRDVAFTIVGLGENVEHAKINATQDHQTDGFAYISEAAIPEIADELTYNEVMIDAQEGYDLDRLGQSIEALSIQRQLLYLDQASKERTFNYTQLTETIENNLLMSRVIPFVLFSIEAIILFLAMSRMIDSQRTQVGIMKALGVKNRSIMLHYMGYPALVGIVGSILGCVLADLLFVPLITESNARAYSLPGIHFSLAYDSVFPPMLFSSAFGFLSCYFSGRSLLRERAAQAMRPKPPKKMKKLMIERIPGLWDRTSYSSKLILRNIFLNKPKALASSIGVIVSTVLLITAFGTESALQKVAGQVEEVYSYDLRIDLAMGTSADSIQLPSGVQSGYGLSTFPVEIMKEADKEDATLVVTDKENNLIHFYDTSDNKISLEDNGVLVPKSYADQYQISEGDIIQLRFAAPELNNKSVNMKVLNISNQYSNPSFYCTPAYLKSFGVDYDPTSLFVKANSSEDLTNVRLFFEQNPHVDTIADKKDLQKSAQYILKQNSFVFIMFIVSAVILSFGAIYTISSINIYERSRELATLKVLGYQRKKINRLIFLENIILTAFAVLIALPISGKMFALIVKALSSTHQQIPDQLNAWIMAAAVLLSFLLTASSNFLLRRKVTRINMIEALKGVE